jgi:hypothetical protein
MTKARNIPLERLDFETMASSGHSLRLTERVTWEDFPSYAETVVSLLGGTVVQRADSAPERVWDVRIDGAAFWISFDDFGLGVSLDPQTVEAGRLMPSMRATLLELGSTRGTG